MRKNILICLLLVLTAGFGTLYCAGPETPVPTWERTYGGSERDILKDCIQTTNGDYVMVGYTLSSDITLRNAIVIKTDGNGNTLWEKTFWSPFRTTGSGSYLNSVKETGDGGYIIAGETVVEETWLLKLDQDGNKEWERQLYSGPNQFGFTTTVMVTEEGDFVLSGYSGIYNNADAWLAKVDDGGDVIWQKTFASNYKTYIHAMDATSDNGYILAGHKQIGSSHNGVLIKTDSSGNLEWTKLYGGSEIDFIYDVKHTGDGGYVFTGISQSYHAGSGHSAWAAKTDAGGNTVWNQTYDGLYGQGMCLLKTGSSYVIGGRKTGSGGSGSDIYLVYIGQNGEEQLSRTWGGVKNDSCYALIATADGGVIAAGTKNTTDTNREDLYLAKVPPITPPAPAITELTPGSGYVGSVVTVTGENFGDSEGTVEFNGTVATIQSWSDTQIVTAVPQGASSGTVTVQTGNAVCTGPVFTVNTPFITVTSPNGGEVWQAGDSRTITWNSSPGISHVKIEFSTAGFAGTYVAAHSGESIPNTGSYSWTVADADSGQCAIRIWDIAGILSAGSAAVFTIQPAPSILVDSPVDGDNWESGRSHTVNWTASGISGDVTIDLYKGMSYYNIRVTAPADSGAMSLHIPSGFINGTDYRVRIYQGAVEGYSGYFSITGKPNYVFHGNDYNGDQKSDIAFFRPAGGRWYIEGSPSVAWGTAADIPVPGDYNGDGTTDIAIFRPSTGRWCIMGQPSIAWGTANDIPVPGDYDGDGTTDIAIFRPSTGRWCIMGQASISWGTATDIPMPADYNGDGSTDIAIFRSSMGKWCIMGQPSISWGTSSDIPVPADYDGDGDTDIAVFRPSTGRWCIMGQPSIPMGISTDIPIPADFDGDGDADIAIYRPSIGTWFIQGSPSIVFGDSTDIPLISHNGR